jgi:multicomponent Na+:H+ antiporter subunit G
MIAYREWVAIGLMGLGTVFFFAGFLGLARFPDTASRLHALTKADNLGLGLVVTGLMVHHAWSPVQLKLALVYLLALGAAAINGYVIGQRCLRAARPKEKAR